MSEAPGPFRDHKNAPYWRQAHGIGHQWSATEQGRRGCIWMLILAMAVFVIVGIVAGLVVLLR